MEQLSRISRRERCTSYISKMDDSQLIELVREHSGLYNPKHPEYKDLNIRENVWMEIAALLKQPGECKTFFISSYEACHCRLV